MYFLNIVVLLEETADGNQYTAAVREMPGINTEADSLPHLFEQLYSDIVTWTTESTDVQEAMNLYWAKLGKEPPESVRSNVLGPLREENRGG